MPGVTSPDVRARVESASRLLGAGHGAEAAAQVCRALDATPDDPDARRVLARIVDVARTLLVQGRPADALALLTPIVDSAHAGGRALMLCGYALVALHRGGAAETILGRWAELEPDNRDAALRLAAVLADNGRDAAAETRVRAEITRHGDSTDAAFVLGRALLGQARYAEAEAEFRKVVHGASGHVLAHANLMELVWMRTGDVRAASRELDAVLRAQPQLTGLYITRARLLLSAQRPREALAAVDAGLAVAPGDRDLLQAAATTALDFNADLALGYARRLYALAPGDAVASVVLGNALLAAGDAAAALEVAQSLRRALPYDGQVIALQADALRALGDARYRQLLDYQRLVRTGMIDVPAGWDDLDAYLAELVTALQQVHTLKAHPVGNSLRGGSQVRLDPSRAASAAIRAFPQAIDGPIRRYLQALGTGNDPMRARNTGRYAISGMWSVRLHAQGFHTNHYHPAGWIASACYLRLPAAVSKGGEGWLKFGEAAFPTRTPLGPEYFVRPRPGLLVLFPAYMWHGTVPFSGPADDSRLTIAFDVVPR